MESLVVAVARAFRWKGFLESRRFATLKALAEAVGHERSYVTELLNLTLLAPDLVRAILAGEEPSGLSIGRLMAGVPERWEEQETRLGEYPLTCVQCTGKNRPVMRYSGSVSIGWWVASPSE